MEQWPCIRRLPDGAIDYDFYRGRARAQRAAAIGDALSLKKPKSLLHPFGFLARLRAAWKT